MLTRIGTRVVTRTCATMFCLNGIVHVPSRIDFIYESRIIFIDGSNKDTIRPV